jgi:hypothetical protein
VHFFTLEVQNERLKYLFPDWQKYNLYKCESVSKHYETDIECISHAQNSFLEFLHNEDELNFIETDFNELHYPNEVNNQENELIEIELLDEDIDEEEEDQDDIYTYEDLVEASYFLQCPRNQFDLLAINIVMDVDKFKTLDFSKPILIN